MIKNKLPLSAKFQQAMQTVSKSRILFAHHSVGDNILAGIKSLADEMKTEVTITHIEDIPLSNKNAIVDMRPGTNKDPKSKIDDFVSQINKLSNDFVPDIAFMKLCYVDFNPHTDVGELFAYYKEAMETLKKERQDIEIVHLTVPLTVKPNSLKDRIKRFVGRQIWGDASNIKRCEFNKLLIKTFPKELVFDLAGIESTKADNTRESFVIDGKNYCCLVPEYTDDGGHLNDMGQRHVATEMVKFLAETIQNRRSRPPVSGV